MSRSSASASSKAILRGYRSGVGPPAPFFLMITKPESLRFGDQALGDNLPAGQAELERRHDFAPPMVSAVFIVG